MPHALMISSEMRTALAVGVLGGLGGGRGAEDAGAGPEVSAVSGAFTAAFSPPQATTGTAAAAKTSPHTSLVMVPPFDPTTNGQGLIFQLASRQAKAAAWDPLDSPLEAEAVLAVVRVGHAGDLEHFQSDLADAPVFVDLEVQAVAVALEDGGSAQRPKRPRGRRPGAG